MRSEKATDFTVEKIVWGSDYQSPVMMMSRTTMVRTVGPSCYALVRICFKHVAETRVCLSTLIPRTKNDRTNRLPIKIPIRKLVLVSS